MLNREGELLFIIHRPSQHLFHIKLQGDLQLFSSFILVRVDGSHFSPTLSEDHWKIEVENVEES